MIQCDVTESVIPSGRYRGVTVLSCEMKRRGFGYKRSLFPLIKGFCFRSHGVDACLTLRPAVRRDGSGSVSFRHSICGARFFFADIQHLCSGS